MKRNGNKRKEMEGNDHSQQQGNPRSSRCSKCAPNQLGERVRLHKDRKSMNFRLEHKVSGAKLPGISS